jgi:phospholipid transport system transporter-binding protein
MIRREGNRLHVEGPIDVETVTPLMEQGTTHVRNGAAIVDLAGVTEVDSAAVALALIWVREAQAAGNTLEFVNLPPAMTNLARLYAVADFIPVAHT